MGMSSRRRFARLVLLATATVSLAALPGSLAAQAHEHRPGMTHTPSGSASADADAAASSTAPRESGQAAFAAIAEVVRLLEADSTTDWSRVNLEAVRQHLRDMDLVILSSNVAAAAVEAGVRLEVTGTADVAAAIRRMLHMHATALEAELPVTATVEHHAAGVVFTVVAREAADTAFVTRLRGLGFAGLLVTGNHHAAHHLALARGGTMDHAHDAP